MGQHGEDVAVLRATIDGEEVALLVLSIPAGLDEAELETIYVPVARRNAGIASGALRCAEDYCRQHGFSVLTLWANPLDDETDQERLFDWYKRHGYVDAGGSYELRKIL